MFRSYRRHPGDNRRRIARLEQLEGRLLLCGTPCVKAEDPRLAEVAEIIAPAKQTYDFGAKLTSTGSLEVNGDASVDYIVIEFVVGDAPVPAPAPPADPTGPAEGPLTPVSNELTRVEAFENALHEIADQIQSRKVEAKHPLTIRVTIHAATYEYENYYLNELRYQGDFVASDVRRIVVHGLESRDYIHNKTDVSATIFGDAGDDEVISGHGADLVFGGSGEDTIWGGRGNDVLLGGNGRDMLYGEGGLDTIDGGGGVDRIWGGEDADRLYGGGNTTQNTDRSAGPSESPNTVELVYAELDTEDDARDTIRGEGGNDLLVGGQGDDTLNGGPGADRLEGGEGNDSLFGGEGNDQIYGGADGDTNVSGGPGDDLMEGGPGDDTLHGDAGDDILIGGAGEDELYGGDDVDELHGGLSDDELFGDGGDDILNGDGGDDKLFGGAGVDELNGHEGDDELSGGDGADELIGGAGEDLLDGEAGDDLLEGGDDNDVLIGGFGSDKLYGGDGDDELDAGLSREQLRELQQELRDAEQSLELSRDPGSIDTLRGENGNDILRGGDGSDVLVGGEGDDALFGGEGVDHLSGGPGSDGLYGGGDRVTDVLRGDGGDDRFGILDHAPKVTFDLVEDLNPEDVYIDFENGGHGTAGVWVVTPGSWSDVHFEAADEAFRLLRRRTGNSALLEEPNGQHFTFVMHNSVSAPIFGPWAGYNLGGRIAIISPHVSRDLFIHEMAHSWQNVVWEDWLVAGQWDFGGQVENATRASQDTFVSDYAARWANEDFAETFEAYFRAMAGGEFAPFAAEAIERVDGLTDKIDILDRMFNALMPTTENLTWESFIDVQAAQTDN